MCFSPLLTWMTASAGITAAIAVKLANKPANYSIPLVYFASMEILQGLMYTQVNHPHSLFTSILIYLAYLNVSFQPLIINYWLGAFISKKQISTYYFTLKLSFIGGLLLLSRIVLFENTPLCSSYETLCSPTPIIFQGVRHIAWSLPLTGAGWNYVNPSIALHMFLFFIPGLLLGFYRLMITFFILGPYLATILSPLPSEQSSIWCVIGLWLLIITVLSCWHKPPRFLIPKQN